MIWGGKGESTYSTKQYSTHCIHIHTYFFGCQGEKSGKDHSMKNYDNSYRKILGLVFTFRKWLLTSIIVQCFSIFIVLLVFLMKYQSKILIKEFDYFNLHEHFHKNFHNFNYKKHMNISAKYCRSPYLFWSKIDYLRHNCCF